MDEDFKNEDKKTLKRKLTKKIKTNAKLLRHKKVTMPQAKAFSVHLLTASGSFLAFLSLISASQKEWTAMFCWLGLALLVDGIDGPIARKLDVKYVLPTWSGELLDNIIDYVTYVLIPAFALYQSGFMGVGLSFSLSAIIVISSAIYYADTSMKTKENFFKGFPVVWNMMVFTLFVVRPGEWITFIIIVLSAIISFLPIYFIHPVRVLRLRRVNFPIFLLWCVFGVSAFFYQLEAPNWVKIGISVTGIYIYCIGAIMQIFPQLGAKNIKKTIK
ncbi:phosphatidylcholine synthase [Bartonella sp. TT110JLCBS]|uniref:phosphatidylcholine synthase n=1 Tax=Bartonella sp. TT110JLCBS TaxID=3243578 RepID=UPI0035CF0246